MNYVAVKNLVSENDAPRDSIASRIWHPSAHSIPRCKCCGSEMQLFIQFDMTEQLNLPFQIGSHFILCMCPNCNEIPSFSQPADGRLPPKYWENTEGNFYAILLKPGLANASSEYGVSFLKPFSLTFAYEDQNNMSEKNMRVSRTPKWLQSEEHFICECGAQMEFFMQISENYSFAKNEDAPPQPDSFSACEYGLFLGNEIYIFACKDQCNENAVWISVQN